MVEIKNKNLDIAQIAASGQCFRMDACPDGACQAICGGRLIRILQDGDSVRFQCSQDEFDGFWKHYFDLDTDYASYISAIDPADEYLRAAADFGSGIRILNQEIWETLVSFLISQQNNIVRIKRCISNICEAYGEKKTAAGGTSFFAFPKAETLAALDEDALMDCNLGYRSKYVVRCARTVASGGIDLDALYKLDYEDARNELLKLYGVGGKVADCICLFALHKIDAFPVDTHIKQVLSVHYPNGFLFERYEGFAGVLQQYMFYYDLNR